MTCEMPVVNTVGTGDSFIAAFTYGVSLAEGIPECMLRGKTRATEIALFGQESGSETVLIAWYINTIICFANT